MKKLIILLILICISSTLLPAQTWSLSQQRPGLHLNDIEFLNTNEGFIFADSNISTIFITAVILKTIDGGQNWNTIPLGNPDYEITKAHFINSNEGFIAGRFGGGNVGLFLKSTDGGQTWFNPVTFGQRLNNVQFINSSTGWVMGDDGYLSKTIDGGNTWNLQNVTGEDINEIKFFNNSEGVMACGSGELYVTTDGGQNWNSKLSGVSEDLTAIAIKNSAAWISGTAGTLLYSTNSGQNWNSQIAAVNIDFNDIAFADNNTGYTAGIAGLMNKTSDAGSTWLNQSSNSGLEIVGIAVPDVNHGWYINEDGNIYAFDNTTGLTANSQTFTINVFPNPAKEFIYLATNDISESYEINIIDVTGRLCKSQKLNPQISVNTISIASLNPGIYFIEIIASNLIINKMFIKKEFN